MWPVKKIIETALENLSELLNGEVPSPLKIFQRAVKSPPNSAKEPKVLTYRDTSIIKQEDGTYSCTLPNGEKVEGAKFRSACEAVIAWHLDMLPEILEERERKKNAATLEFNFEQIDGYHQRAKVPGGWLIKAYDNVTHFTAHEGVQEGHDWRIAMAFVPDPEHLWTIAPTRSKP